MTTETRAKHTQETWTIYPDSISPVTLYIHAGEKEIATVTDGNPAELWANARLIVAAPRMVDTLQSAYIAISAAWGEDDPLAAFIRKVLAKATGETP